MNEYAGHRITWLLQNALPWSWSLFTTKSASPHAHTTMPTIPNVMLLMLFMCCPIRRCLRSFSQDTRSSFRWWSLKVWSEEREHEGELSQVSAAISSKPEKTKIATRRVIFPFLVRGQWMLLRFLDPASCIMTSPDWYCQVIEQRCSTWRAISARCNAEY